MSKLTLHSVRNLSDFHMTKNLFFMYFLTQYCPFQALANSGVTSLNCYNKQGYTPLHMACLANAPECVRALILAGADVNLAASKGVRNVRQTPGKCFIVLHSVT